MYENKTSEEWYKIGWSIRDDISQLARELKAEAGISKEKVARPKHKEHITSVLNARRMPYYQKLVGQKTVE